MNLNRYVSENLIIKIGKCCENILFSEIIVDDPENFIAFVYENDCYISEIRWWEHVHVGAAPNIGYGGPRDPRCPNEFYFAETDIGKKFDEFVSRQAICYYIMKTKEEYRAFELYPALDVRSRRLETGDDSLSPQ